MDSLQPISTQKSQARFGRLPHVFTFYLSFGLLFLISGVWLARLLLSGEKISAAWFDESYRYRQSVVLTNGGTNQTDFQISFTLDTATLITAGKMQSDCDDLRITDTSGKVLPHWIATGNTATTVLTSCNTATTLIWTKIPSIPTTGSTIYVYFGNNLVGNKEDPKKVFYFFDDFTTATSNAWSVTSGTWTVASGVASQTTSTGGAYRAPLNMTLNDNYAFEARIALTTETQVSFAQNGIAAVKDASNTISTSFRADSSDKVAQIQNTYTGSTTTYNDTNFNYVLGTYYRVTGTKNGTSPSATIKNIIDGTTRITQGSINATDGVINVDLSTYQALSSYDYVHVSKSAATEPTVGAPGSEEKTPSIIAYWTLNDGTGTTAQDSSTSNYDGTLTSGPTWQTDDACISDKCVKFDGTDDYITVTSTTPLSMTGAMTASVWFKSNLNSYASPTYRDLVSKGGVFTSNTAYSLGVRAVSATDMRPYFYWRNGATLYGAEFASAFTNDYKWHHLVAVRDASYNLSLYLDGELVGTDASNAVAVDGTQNVYVGWGTEADADEGTWNGSIDEVKLYNFARTATQVKTDYNVGSSRTSTSKGTSVSMGGSNKSGEYLSNSLIGYWKMDDASGNATDSSGNAYTLTNQGTATFAAGQYGAAGTLNGTTQAFTYATGSTFFTGTGDKTFSVWAKVGTQPGANATYTLLSWGNATHRLILRYEDVSGVKRVGIGDGATNIGISNRTLTTGSWYHYTLVFSGTTAYVYENGVLIGSSTVNIATASDGFGVGRQQTEVLNYFNGSLDEVRVFGRALSAAEVASLSSWAAGPIGWWKLDDNTGTSAADSSAGGNAGTLTLGPTYGVGKFGSGVKFDGSDDYINLPAAVRPGATNYYTMEAWVKRGTISTTQGIIGNNNGTGASGFYLQFNAGNTIECGKIAVVALTSSATLTDTTAWHHVACAISPSGMFLYLDGALIASNANTANISDYNGFIGVGAINEGSAGIGKWLNGSIDDVRLYRYARTQKQVVEDMNAGHPGVGSPVGSAIGHWKFDEGALNTCSGGTNDVCNSGSVGSALDGAITGAATWTNSGKVGKGLRIQSSQYASIADNNALDVTDEVTLSTWILQYGETNSGVFYKGSFASSQGVYSLIVGDGAISKVIFRLNGSVSEGAGQLTSSVEISAGLWNHVVATYSKSQGKMRIYINGRLDSENNYSTSITTDANSFYLGCYYSSSFCLADGTLDEAKIYNTALTAEEVRVEYNRGSAQVLGATGDNTNYGKNAANQVYCVPGDSTSCTAPVGEWMLDENTGTTARGTGSSVVNGTLTSGPVYGPGKFGPGVVFDGVNDLITMGDNFDLGGSSMTFSAWVKTTDIDAEILSKGTTADYSYSLLLVSDNTLRFTLHQSAGSDYCLASATSSGGVVDGKWHHVVGVWTSASKCDLFVDGVLKATDNTFAGTLDTDTVAAFYVAGRADGDRPFLGSIDQVLVYNYARSPAQIAWDYNRGGPVGWWKFDECQGATAYDASVTNAFNGTITEPGGGGNLGIGSCTSSASMMRSDGVTGKFASSLDFDGADDYVEVADNSALQLSNKMSLSAWIKTSDAGASSMGIVRKDTTSGTRYLWGLQFSPSADGKVSAEYYNGTNYTKSSLSVVNDGVWHNILMTIDGTTLTLYVDGKSQGTTTISGTQGAPTGVMDIGADPPSTAGGRGFYFNGQIDDVRVYNYPLTTTQVKLIFNENSAVRFGPQTGSP